MLSRIYLYLKLMRFDKPIGSLLLLWPTFWALWLANHGSPPIKLIAIFTLGVILTRALGCVINDVADRNLDCQVERTRDRPLTSGRVSLLEAIVIAIILACLGFLLVLQLNPFAIKLSFFALAIMTIYPFSKRWFKAPQTFLGIAFAMGIPMAFAASMNQLPPLAFLLFVATFFWIVAYDTCYALMDYQDDVKVGINSTAVLFGKYSLPIICVCIIIFLALILYLAIHIQFGAKFYMIYILILFLFAWQFKLLLRKSEVHYYQAFLVNHWIGMLVFLAFFISIK